MSAEADVAFLLSLKRAEVSAAALGVCMPIECWGVSHAGHQRVLARFLADLFHFYGEGLLTEEYLLVAFAAGRELFKAETEVAK